MCVCVYVCVCVYREFPTRMVYLYYISCLRYTILEIHHSIYKVEYILQDDIAQKEGTTWNRKAIDTRQWKALMEGCILQ